MSEQNFHDSNAYKTIAVRYQGSICTIVFNRPEAKNTINDRLINEITTVLDHCERDITVIILEGNAEIFCFGADFDALGSSEPSITSGDPEPSYNLWDRLREGPYITIAHVRGKANAGGVGFVAACDIVIADDSAVFSLSELLFGLMPACVMPFLIQRIGNQKAHYMTLMTQPITAQQALSWGLVDVLDSDSNAALRKHLLRLRRLSKTGISRYKRYVSTLTKPSAEKKQLALDANKQVFSDPQNIQSIARYVNEGKFPWEP